MAVNIIYEDDNLIVVFKPAGLATQTKKVGEKDLVSELKKHLKGGYVGVIHRLDQPVEGLLVFAKDAKTAAKLSAQVQKKGDTFVKDYVAVSICSSTVDVGKTVCLENYMVKTKEQTALIIDKADIGKYPEAKLAKLSYEVLEVKNGLAFVRVHLQTGRFHQIRAQLKNAGLQILGDRKYGDDENKELALKKGVRHVLLCADKLEFSHPITGKLLEFSTESEDIKRGFE